jgi:hypothetical protein
VPTGLRAHPSPGPPPMRRRRAHVCQVEDARHHVISGQHVVCVECVDDALFGLTVWAGAGNTAQHEETEAVGSDRGHVRIVAAVCDMRVANRKCSESSSVGRLRVQPSAGKVGSCVGGAKPRKFKEWLSPRGSSWASRRRTAKEGSAAAATPAATSADCASMRAFMSAICSGTSARVEGVGMTELYGEPRSGEARGD